MSEKVRVTVHLPARLVERIRDAAVAVPANRGGGGISSLVEFAVEKHLAQLVKKFGRIPKRSKPPRTGPR